MIPTSEDVEGVLFGLVLHLFFPFCALLFNFCHAAATIVVPVRTSVGRSTKLPVPSHTTSSSCGKT
jgi:hypothetical protein